jgi:hypothetical protein
VTIYLANSGAAGTFVEDIDVTDFKHHGDALTLWSGIDEEIPVAASWGVGKETVFERSDAHRGTLKVYLARSPDIATAEEVARRVAGLRSVEVTVRWAFRRARLLRPGQRETKRNHVHVPIDGATYHNACVAEWREIEATQHLADIAEGKVPPSA